ncbi:hypothetical protein BJF87_23835 [Gordonia sp. CNJ-863]|uniref:helix-turn-helix domain-containing protein n=1 Tax=Gordonia sp. CNJ-863 TaxID=1904963 RepID=UPI00095DFCF2|nr:helix-turn-helix transcriptional regulator [Gordonia sp. CNJ-863]OLT44989.1 hypothetical protein BJF87_23835 [Gordonia sp. CNJ-863]
MRGFNPDALRAARGEMSVKTLARLARVGRSTVHHWENGSTVPQIDVLRKVCALLGVPIAQIVQVDPATAYPADLRVLAGLTQPELGQKAGLSTATVGYVERGEVELTASTLAALCSALNVPEQTYQAAFERARMRPADDDLS